MSTSINLTNSIDLGVDWGEDAAPLNNKDGNSRG